MTTELFPGFETQQIPVEEDVDVRTVIGGSGPPLLLLHGHPETHVIWHRVAPALTRYFTVVACDLRGYGDSAKPSGGRDHSRYSKRVMARDLVRVMAELGFERFRLMGHDRGARVAHRLAADNADAVERLVLLDIAPTLAMYEQTDERFARAYWHWFFLIQPAPLPERLIEANPAGYVRHVMNRSGGLSVFDERALAEYERCLALPGAGHALCEDYRASAGPDLDLDRADREAGRRLSMPLLVLWGEKGVIQRCFSPLDEWRKVADQVAGHSLPCGHYIPEEAPEMLLDAASPFLLR